MENNLRTDLEIAGAPSCISTRILCQHDAVCTMESIRTFHTLMFYCYLIVPELSVSGVIMLWNQSTVGGGNEGRSKNPFYRAAQPASNGHAKALLIWNYLPMSQSLGFCESRRWKTSAYGLWYKWSFWKKYQFYLSSHTIILSVKSLVCGNGTVQTEN